MASSSTFPFVGGHPALDFLNTVAWRLSDEPEERVGSFADLVRWARQARLIDARERRALEAAAARSPERAARALRGALELREVGYSLLQALLAGKKPAPAALRKLNEFLALHEDRVDWVNRSYVRTTGSSVGALERLHDLLTRSLADFLTSPEGRHVGQCQDDRGCGWVFVDRSRSKVRRWCSMADCGNRAKARRHYQRTTH